MYLYKTYMTKYYRTKLHLTASLNLNSWNNVEIAPKRIKELDCERLSKYISDLIFRRDEFNLQKLLCYTLTNNMEIHFNVLCASMKDRIS